MVSIILVFPNDFYSHQTNVTIDRDELSDSFWPNVSSIIRIKTSFSKLSHFDFKIQKM